MILEGRQLTGEPPEGHDCQTGVCVFCGRGVEHVSDGGTAYVAGGFLNGAVHYFLYCAEECPGDHSPRWMCHSCSVDCLSSRCHACGKARHLVDSVIFEI